MVIQDAPRPAAALSSSAADADAALAQAQLTLAAEWAAAAPSTPAAVAAFYRTSTTQATDQAAWHATADRQTATGMLVTVVQQTGARRIVDIGCGAGYDLAALRAADPGLHLAGVEPNVMQRWQATAALVGSGPITTDANAIYADVAEALIEEADCLICIDVLEHVPDPETFLGAIAARAPLGCYFFETTATDAIGNPLHLRANWGWHPGRVLHRHGWQLASFGGSGRVRVWQRTAVAAPVSTAILLCAYRAVSAQTVEALQVLQTISAQVGHVPCRPPLIKHGDGLISRSRSILASRWWAETADDVFLMLDDDITFDPFQVLDMIALCREKRSIVCGGYPVGDASHLALRVWPDQAEFPIGPGAPPVSIEYAATGMMVCHRDVLDALIPTLPLCHADTPWAFWPLFDTSIVPMGDTLAYISEDWHFSLQAREAGFTIWMDPRVIATHLKEVEINLHNIGAMHAAIAQAKGGR